MLEKMSTKGLFLALRTTAIWGLYTVLMKVGAVSFDNLHPFVFILQAYLVGSLVLLLAGGPGDLSKDTLKNYSTWGYGLLTLFNNAFLVSAFYYSISAASVTLLVRSGIIISLIFDYVILKNRKIQNKLAYITLLAGLIVVICGVKIENAIVPITLVLLAALFQVTLLKLAEVHKQNNKATGSIRAELRVSGFMSAASSFSFMVFILIAYFSGLQIANVVPTTAQMLDLDSLIFATIVGVTVISLSKYFMLVSTKTVGTTNFLTVAALTPIFTLLFELLFAAFGVLEMRDLNVYEIAGGILIITASLLVTQKNIKRKTKKASV